jgi:hypothetical protein
MKKRLPPGGPYMKKQLSTIIAAAIGLTMGACEKNNRSFSIFGQSQSFQQGGQTFQQRKIDILFVIDNSGSMQTSQANLAANFASFINQFQTLGIDYHMAVTTSDAYLADPSFNNSHSNYTPGIARFADGYSGTYGLGHSGVPLMTPLNNSATVFQKNISEGASGNGDERVFSSFVQALSDTALWADGVTTNVNSGFRRSDAFLSIILLSDEDDFSGTASNCDHLQSSCRTVSPFIGDHNFNAAAPYLQPVSYFVSWLDTYAGGHNNYSVSSIYADSASCITTLNAGAPSSSRVIAQRMPALSAATNGIAASLCSNFGTTLAGITQSVLELADVFQLSIVPLVSTIVVTVNGVTVPQDASNGWSYDSVANTVSFHGNAIPAAGADIQINFTPANVLNK